MRTRLSFVAGGIGALLVLAATPVVAHHAFNAEFDAHHTYIPRFCQMYAATGADLSMPALHCRSTGFGSRS